MIRPEARAYIAGLFEGEGCIVSVTRTKLTASGNPRRGIELKISMTDREPLDLFDDIVGFGVVRGPYLNRFQGIGTKNVYEYRVSNYQHVQFIVCNMWEWLSPRRKEQIKKALLHYTGHKTIRANRLRRNVRAD